MSLDVNTLSLDQNRQKQQQSQTPIEANFIKEFHENKEDVEWFKKVNEKYGDKISNFSYPFVIERMINRLNSRNRSTEIYEHIDKYINDYHKYALEIENIMNINIKNESLLLQFWKIYMYGYDKQGHPIMYDEIASADINDISNAIKSKVEEKQTENKNDEKESEDDIVDNLMESLKQFRFKFYGKMSYLKQIQSKKYNTTIFKHMLVMDLKDFSYYNIISNVSIFSSNSNGISPLNMIKSVITDERMLYPQGLYKLYLINCPWSFQLLWTVISKFIGAESQKKVNILGSNYLDEMLKDIDIDQIPVKYGGKGKWDITLGDMCK